MDDYDSDYLGPLTIILMIFFVASVLVLPYQDRASLFLYLIIVIFEGIELSCYVVYCCLEYHDLRYLTFVVRMGMSIPILIFLLNYQNLTQGIYLLFILFNLASIIIFIMETVYCCTRKKRDVEIVLSDISAS